nr:PREDICTED: snRNA-activating protein complex subunit 2 [Latimeria chalumnae]|eukprot:XP_014352624.1 PREDICTED: snRNA-activating protein complex subunit 2 [Latimeria chalumnae]
MKPPERRRSAPVRYEVESTVRKNLVKTEWNVKEKQILLRALKQQVTAEELNIQKIKRLLPKKSAKEVAAFINMLTGRVAREAAQKAYLQWVEEQRLKERFAPIQLCHFLSGLFFSLLFCLESAVVLDLVMSLPAEIPLLECHQLQSHMHQAYKTLISPSHADSNLTGTSDSGPSSSREQEVGPTNQEEDSHPSNEGDAPSSQTSLERASGSVSTPEQTRVGENGTGVKDAPSGQPRPGMDKNLTAQTPGSPPARSGQSDKASQKDTQRPATNKKDRDWKDIGVCPLNPFMIPVKLLARDSSSN